MKYELDPLTPRFFLSTENTDCQSAPVCEASVSVLARSRNDEISACFVKLILHRCAVRVYQD